MKLTELNNINKDHEFRNSVYQFQRGKLLGLTAGSALVIGLWFFFDSHYSLDNPAMLLWLRVATMILLAVNLLVAGVRNSEKGYEQHLIAGFWLDAIHCTLLTMLTGASLSPYWYGLFFVLAGWFVMLSLPYRMMILHGALFLLVFISAQSVQTSYETDAVEMWKMIFLYAGVIIVGSFSAISKNISDARRFLSELEIKKINSSLSESQQFMNSLLKSAPLVIWCIDKEGVFTYSQYQGEDALPDSERIGKSALEIYRGTEVESFLGKVLRDEIREAVIRVGSVHYDTRVTPIVDPDGVQTGYMGISLDITERVRTENELKKFRLALDQAPLAVFIMDRNWNFEYLNPEFIRLSGYTNEDLLHRNIRDTLYRDFEDVPASRRDIVVSMQAGRSWKGELRSYNKQGDTYWAYTIASPYKNEAGEIDGYIVIQQDVTEKRQIEQALRASEEQYKTLIDKATDGIVITQDGKLKFLNHAMVEMMQYDADEMIGKSFLDYVVPESHEEMMEYSRRRTTGEEFHVMYRSWFIRKDGQILTVELNARTSEYEGRPAAFIVIRDITNRLVVEKELMQAKSELEALNKSLEERIRESSESLTEARTQLISLQKENLQSQFEVLRQQVNPHFLFNSLNVLTSLIKLEPDLAEKFTEHLSKVYRYVLENKDNDLVALRTELDFLDAYLFLLNIRFRDKIRVTLRIPDEEMSWLILPLALQLLIENAIKHNAMSKKAPLKIDLFIDNEGFLNVENNLQERESFIASTGVGLKNIEHRYTLLEMPEPEFVKTASKFIARIPLKKG
jgi:PAS domain S-box-containing protein